MKRPRNLGARPAQPAGPSPTGELMLEHLSDEEGWAVIDERGRQVNPFLRTAPAVAYYLFREQLTDRISNLELLTPVLQQIAKGEKKTPFSI